MFGYVSCTAPPPRRRLRWEATSAPTGFPDTTSVVNEKQKEPRPRGANLGFGQGNAPKGRIRSPGFGQRIG
jgi:hypothetical protein